MTVRLWRVDCTSNMYWILVRISIRRRPAATSLLKIAASSPVESLSSSESLRGFTICVSGYKSLAWTWYFHRPPPINPSSNSVFLRKTGAVKDVLLPGHMLCHHASQSKLASPLKLAILVFKDKINQSYCETSIIHMGPIFLPPESVKNIACVDQ